MQARAVCVTNVDLFKCKAPCHDIGKPHCAFSASRPQGPTSAPSGWRATLAAFAPFPPFLFCLRAFPVLSLAGRASEARELAAASILGSWLGLRIGERDEGLREGLRIGERDEGADKRLEVHLSASASAFSAVSPVLSWSKFLQTALTRFLFFRFFFFGAAWITVEDCSSGCSSPPWSTCSTSTCVGETAVPSPWRLASPLEGLRGPTDGAWRAEEAAVPSLLEEAPVFKARTAACLFNPQLSVCLADSCRKRHVGHATSQSTSSRQRVICSNSNASI